MEKVVSHVPLHRLNDIKWIQTAPWVYPQGSAVGVERRPFILTASTTDPQSWPGVYDRPGSIEGLKPPIRYVFTKSIPG